MKQLQFSFIRTDFYSLFMLIVWDANDDSIFVYAFPFKIVCQLLMNSISFRFVLPFELFPVQLLYGNVVKHFEISFVSKLKTEKKTWTFMDHQGGADAQMLHSIEYC